MGRNFAIAMAGAATALSVAAALPAEAGEAKVLTGQEILSTIIGNTIDGQSGTAFTEFYQPDGVIRGMSGEGRYEGHWSIKDDTLCFEYDQPYGCHKIGLDGNAVSFINETGETDGTGTLIKGNPGNL